MVESFPCTGVAARSTKMNFNRRPFQFSPDFGTERCSEVLRDAFEDFDEPFDTMFSEGLPRWDTPPEFQRFQAGSGHDVPDGSPFSRPNSIFSNRFRNSFGDIPVRVSHQRSGSGDVSDTESRASGSSDGSTGTGRAPKVHHIPIHVESRPQKKQTSPETVPEQEQGPAQQTRQPSPPRRESPEQNFYRSSTPQGREGSPSDASRFSTMPQFRTRTFSDMMQNRARPRVSIPVQVERSDSSPVIGNERQAQRKSPERGPEPATGTFPRAKNQETPLKWAQSFFRPKQTQEPEQSEPVAQPQPAPPQKTQLGPQERIDKVLSDLKVLIAEVQQFQGTDNKSKEYRYLDEMLTRLMLSLDDVIIDGNESLRAARRAAVKAVERVIDQLEAKVRANAVENQLPRQQQQQQQQQQEQFPQQQQPEESTGQHAAGDVDRQQLPAESSPDPSQPEQTFPTEPKEATEQTQIEQIEEVSKSETPTPPKRDKSPVKKRHLSPEKEKRSPSPKKDSNKRDKSPTKKDLSKREKSPLKKAPETGGVSVTVNGVFLQNTQPEPASPEPVTSTATIELKK